MPRTRLYNPLPGTRLPSVIAIVITLAVTVSICAHAAAPATQPSASQQTENQWSDVVSTFAKALTDADSDAPLRTLLSDATVIRQFGRTQRDSIFTLHRKTAGLSALAVHGYIEAPSTLASDLSGDVHEADDLPDSLKKQFSPDDDEALARANVTAAKWVAASLSSAPTDPIGVIVLWRKNEPAPIFVLLKGEMDNGKLSITQVCFGDPTAPASSPAGNVAGSGD